MASLDFTTPDHKGRIYLRNHHSFGRRNKDADTSIQYPLVSKRHATIEWQAPNWILKDTSKNGTKLNDNFIPKQEAVAINVGDVIDLAGEGDVLLKVLDIDEPIPMLISDSTSKKPITLGTDHLLPSEQQPEVALRLCPDRSQWFSDDLSTGLETGPYTHGDTINIGSESWAFLLPKGNEASDMARPQLTNIKDVVFRFDIEESTNNINLTLVESGLEIDLGERAHYPLLVLLLKHTNNSGWVTYQKILDTLSLDIRALNLQLFELRKQLASVLPSASGHSKLIERKPEALRTNIKNFKIIINEAKDS